MELKVIELFSGIGSQAKALKNINANFEIVATADWDIYANISYAAIHHNKELTKKIKYFDENKEVLNTKEEREKLEKKLESYLLSRDSKNPISSLKSFKTRVLFIIYESLKLNNSFTDIKSIKGEELPEHNMITYSFPCQDLSLQGVQKGLTKGKSSSMLWEVQRIIEELNDLEKLPKYLVMENVKSLYSKKYEKGFAKWVNFLEKMGYTNHKFILNAKNFDVPQNRERAFMVSELKQNKFKEPVPGPITKKTIKSVLNKEWVEWKPTKGKVNNWNPEKNKNGLAKSKIEGYTTFQSEIAVFGKNSIAPTITATGALNRIKIIEDNKKLRMLTSQEQWQLMGFTKSDWKKVNDLNVVPEMNLRKQAGNSIVVQVLEAIFKNVK